MEKSRRRIWLGTVVPKRQARRAVTRNLLKRQVRHVFMRRQAGLADGLWLVRVRQGFAASEFSAASSRALRDAVRRELDDLFDRAHRVEWVVRPPAAAVESGVRRP